MDEIVKIVVETTLQDIEKVKDKVPPFKEYWLKYSEEVPVNLRASISQKIYHETGVKVYWASGKEVKIVLSDE